MDSPPPPTAPAHLRPPPPSQGMLFIGLGNPGKAHIRQRHNIGFRAVETIAARYGFAPPRERFGGLLQEGRIGDNRLRLFRPLSYMNRSGIPAAAVMRFFRLSQERLLVFHDELDLAPGKLRVKRGGGTAGHNGLRSLTTHIGADFLRARIGIGHPGSPEKVLPYVLGDFAAAEEATMQILLAAMADNAPLLLDERHDAFASRSIQQLQAAQAE